MRKKEKLNQKRKRTLVERMLKISNNIIQQVAREICKENKIFKFRKSESKHLILI